jgi:hypothetical protein
MWTDAHDQTRVRDSPTELLLSHTAHSVAGICSYVPGSNGPGSEKPSIAPTFA